MTDTKTSKFLFHEILFSSTQKGNILRNTSKESNRELSEIPLHLLLALIELSQRSEDSQAVLISCKQLTNRKQSSESVSILNGVLRHLAERSEKFIVVHQMIEKHVGKKTTKDGQQIK